MSRRALLAAVAGATLAAPSLAASGSASNEALAATYARLLCSMEEYETADDDRRLDLDKVEAEALDRLCKTPAISATGCATKARAFLRWGFYREPDDEHAAAIAESLCRDLLICLPAMPTSSPASMPTMRSGEDGIRQPRRV